MVKKRGGSGKRPKKPPAKTPYDVICPLINGVLVKKVVFWGFSGRVGSARSQLFMPGLHHAHTLQHTS